MSARSRCPALSGSRRLGSRRGRQDAHMPSPMHCKQNKLHSLLCDTSAWVGQDAKKQVSSRGFNHVGPFTLPSLILPLPSRPGEPYTDSNARFLRHQFPCSSSTFLLQHTIFSGRTQCPTPGPVSNACAGQLEDCG